MLASVFLASLAVVSATPIRRSVPSGYLNPQFGQTQANIYSYALDAFNDLVKGVNSDGSFTSDYSKYPTPDGQYDAGPLGGWVGQNAWTAIANYDKIHGTTVFEQAFNSAQYAISGTYYAGSGWTTPFVDQYNDDAGWAALANIAGYDAYGDAQYLSWAEGVWQFIVGHGYVDTEDVDAGRIVNDPRIERPLAASCNGSSNIGAVTWMNVHDSSPLGINAVSTGLFALLSVELYARTQNETYADRALTSLTWLDNHLLMANGELMDNIDMEDCTGPNWYFSYNQGLYVNSYAKLGGLKNNAEYITKARNAVEAGISTSDWNSNIGINNQGAGDPSDGMEFRAIWARYLLNSYQYFDSATQADMLQYINIQYYAITQNAANSNSQPVDFSDNWTTSYDSGNQNAATQISALDVLNAITLNPASAYPSSSSNTVPVSHT